MATLLRDAVGEWVEVLLPDSDRPVRLLRLRSDPLSKASVSLVRFPPDWRRPTVGYYDSAEEFVILEGGIDVIGRHTVGDYVYLPPRTVRDHTVSDEGALVLAYFSGAVDWHEGRPAVGPPGDPVFGAPRGVMRAAEAQTPPGSYMVLDRFPVEPFTVNADVLGLETCSWEWVPAGARASITGPVHVRTWA